MLKFVEGKHLITVQICKSEGSFHKVLHILFGRSATNNLFDLHSYFIPLNCWLREKSTSVKNTILVCICFVKSLADEFLIVWCRHRFL